MDKCLNCHAQHPHAGVPPFLCGDCSAAMRPPVAPFREEMTPIGIQLVIPGCERRPTNTAKPAQLNLFA